MRSNCLFWVVWMRISQGGHINWSRSRTWRGFHVTWTDSQGTEWEYTLPVIKKQPWWYIPILYRGVVKAVKQRKP